MLPFQQIFLQFLLILHLEHLSILIAILTAKLLIISDRHHIVGVRLLHVVRLDHEELVRDGAPDLE